MNYKLMTAVSALALMISYSAYAQGIPASNQETTISDDVKKGLRSADDAMYETAEDIKAFFVGDNAAQGLVPVLVRSNMTAHNLIGKTVVNAKGDRIATVKDIIIGKNGKAALIVMSDNGLLGIGSKVAAFDYNRVVTQRYDGSVVMALSQDMIDRAADFSYDPKDWAKAKVIPSGSVSTNVLLDGDVLDNEGNKMASIENVYFRYAEVTQIIVGFNKTMGMGGDLASLDYDDMRMIRRDGGLDFKLTKNQSEHFRRFKTSVSN